MITDFVEAVFSYYGLDMNDTGMSDREQSQENTLALYLAMANQLNTMSKDNLNFRNEALSNIFKSVVQKYGYTGGVSEVIEDEAGHACYGLEQLNKMDSDELNRIIKDMVLTWGGNQSTFGMPMNDGGLWVYILLNYIARERGLQFVGEHKEYRLGYKPDILYNFILDLMMDEDLSKYNVFSSEFRGIMRTIESLEVREKSAPHVRLSSIYTKDTPYELFFMVSAMISDKDPHKPLANELRELETLKGLIKESDIIAMTLAVSTIVVKNAPGVDMATLVELCKHFRPYSPELFIYCLFLQKNQYYTTGDHRMIINTVAEGMLHENKEVDINIDFVEEFTKEMHDLVVFASTTPALTTTEFN